MFGDVQHIYGLGASLTAAAITACGLLSIAAFGAMVQRYGALFSAFAVGLLMVGVLFHLVLEALNISMDALTWVGTGFMVMALIGIAIHAVFNRRADGAALTFGYASIIALSAHSFLDGVIYALVFQEEPFTGWLTTAGLLTHEYPEGIIAYFLLSHAGLGVVRSMLYGFLAAGATTVAGTLLGNVILSFTMNAPLAAMYGGAAGALIYVLVVHLGPQATKASGGGGYAAAQFGVIVGTIAVILHSIGGGGH